jgi:hypothetical protein
METQEKTDVELVKEAIARLRPLVRVTKIVCTRSVKGLRGDSYVGFSAAWDTVQDDAGGGADMITTQEGTPSQVASNGLSLRDSRLAALMLGMQVDIAAHAQALAGGNLDSNQFEAASRAIRNNYTKLIADMVRAGNGNGGK